MKARSPALSGSPVPRAGVFKLPRLVVLSFLGAYKRCLSPLLPPACRYYPTCSQYTREAVERYGACKGLYLGARRLLRCHPMRKGGFDPVP